MIFGRIALWLSEGNLSLVVPVTVSYDREKRDDCSLQCPIVRQDMWAFYQQRKQNFLQKWSCINTENRCCLTCVKHDFLVNFITKYTYVFLGSPLTEPTERGRKRGNMNVSSAMLLPWIFSYLSVLVASSIFRFIYRLRLYRL